jgi:hypothetical protein
VLDVKEVLALINNVINRSSSHEETEGDSVNFVHLAVEVTLLLDELADLVDSQQQADA